MRSLRTASTRRLLAIVAVLVATVAAAGIAQAALTSAPKPAPKALDKAIYDAVNAKPVEGVTARVKFTNNLLPSGSLPRETASPVLTGADGRLWLTNDGKVRLELQSANGDAQLVVDEERYMLYDAASKTAFVGRLPQNKTADKPEQKASLSGIQQGLAKLGEAWTLSGAQPSTTAGRPTYTVRIAPKDDGGLLGAAEVAWDAVRGVPLRAAIYAQGNDNPVLEVEATDVAYGKIPAAKVTATPPAGAKVTEFDPPSSVDAQGQPVPHVEGVEAVQKQLSFKLAAPATLAGLPRQGVVLATFGNEKGALLRYGSGLGQILVFQRKAPGTASSALTLPQVNIDGATGQEIATALGTFLTFNRDGVSYVVAGSVPPVAAENAARDLR